MSRPSADAKAEQIARYGGPPMPLPANLDDMGPILARWPMMVKYDPQSGELWWRYVVESSRDPDSLDRRDYLATHSKVIGNRRVNMIRIDGFLIPAPRMVWLLQHGAWPKGRLKWRDGNPLNDRIENLQEDVEIIGRGPPRKRAKGVSRLWDGWQAYVDLGQGRRHYIGRRFLTEVDAIAARAAWDASQAAEAVGDLI